MQVANKICPRCHNANYVRYLEESDAYKYKCINCSLYFNDKMTIEETINGLQSMINSKQFISHNFDGVVDEDVCERAIELLKEQEPKVLTLVELKQFDERPCWFESHGTYMGQKGFWIIPYMFTCYETMYYVYPLMQINDRGDCHYSELGLSAYNKAWRCWSSQPTDEQRKAVTWDA